jgi:SP family arabinose:H+ symporter-like MFS transporter
MKVESYGRRYLLLLGMSIIAICLLILSISFALIGDTNEMSTIGKISSTAAVFGVAGGYSLSFGPLVWLITSEIFPSNIRGRALGMSSICSYVAAYLVSYTFFTGKGFALIFATYFLLTFMSIIFTYVSIPDTTKKTAEEIHADLGRLWGAKYGTISA